LHSSCSTGGAEKVERRRFFRHLADSLKKAVGEFAYEVSKPTRAFLRPPGSADEDTFLYLCRKCGRCVDACPSGVLEKVSTPNPVVLDTPFMNFENNYCTACYSCIDACPSGALSRDNLKVFRYVAVLDVDRCVAYRDVFCQSCYWSCPNRDSAITLKDFAYPEFHQSACAGCGRCVHACPTIPPSVEMRKVKVGGSEDPRSHQTG